MKKIFKNFFGKKAEAAMHNDNSSEMEWTPTVPEVKNSPEVENFMELLREFRYEDLYKILKGGFNPNQKCYWVEWHSSEDCEAWTMRRGYIMDYVRKKLQKDEALEKLLREFGAKTSNEILGENRAKEEREDFLREKENMKIVNELLAQK